MTATEPNPTAEHIDAVALMLADLDHYRRGNTLPVGTLGAVYRERAVRVLTSTDPAVHAAMLAALVRAGVLRSPETVDPIAWTIHVEVPTDATEAEVGMLQDRVADAAYGMERGKWDPLVSAHTLDCVASDHCAAPRPDGPPYPKPEVAP
jgi:hypothetical protein